MKQKTGRKAKKMIDERFGNCVVLRKANYRGNNLQYEALCDCGQTFLSSGQQFRATQITECPACRKRKRRESREVERRKRLEKANKISVKYVLMNRKKTEILRGRLGIHAYFDRTKARIAARILEAVVVPLSEANECSGTR